MIKIIIITIIIITTIIIIIIIITITIIIIITIIILIIITIIIILIIGLSKPNLWLPCSVFCIFSCVMHCNTGTILFSVTFACNVIWLTVLKIMIYVFLRN